MALLLILDCFEILRHNFLVDQAIDQSVVLSSTKEDHLILRRVFRVKCRVWKELLRQLPSKGMRLSLGNQCLT